MTITHEQIERMRTNGRMRIDANLEENILTKFGVEADGPEYTEQDVHEQIRKLINQYNHEHPAPDLVDTSTRRVGSSSTPPAQIKHTGGKLSK